MTQIIQVPFLFTNSQRIWQDTLIISMHIFSTPSSFFFYVEIKNQVFMAKNYLEMQITIIQVVYCSFFKFLNFFRITGFIKDYFIYGSN